MIEPDDQGTSSSRAPRPRIGKRASRPGAAVLVLVAGAALAPASLPAEAPPDAPPEPGAAAPAPGDQLPGDQLPGDADVAADTGDTAVALDGTTTVAAEQADEPRREADDGLDGIRLGPMTVHGDFSQRYRYRSSDGQTDQDLYGYMSLSGIYEARTPAEREIFSSLGFNLQGSYNWDIDSFPGGQPTGSGSYDPFVDLTDTWAERAHGYLYEANAQAKDLLIFEDVKLGRQTVYRETPMLFDGGYLRTQRWNTLSFDAWGGSPAHLYESSPSGDVVAGAGVESRPLSGLSLGVDYTYIQDERGEIEEATDHLYRVYGRYNFLREWTIGASGSWNGTRDRRQTFDLRYLSEAIGLLANFRFLRQNGIVDFQTSELSPYVFVEGAYAPYYQFQLDLHQPIAEKFGVGGGFNIRQLEDSGDSGPFNHSFNNFYLSADTFELWEGMRLNVRGDLWDANAGDEIYSAGVEFEQSVWIARVRLGTTYSLYRFDELTGEEKERDRIYYVRVRWQATKNVSFDTDYMFEQDSESEYHVALGGIRIWF